MKKIYFGLTGAITGFLLALLKIYFKGAGTFQVDSFYDGLTNLIFFPISTFLILYLFNTKKLKSSKKHIFIFYLLVVLLITINQSMSHILFGSKPTRFLIGLLPTYIFYFIFFGILILFLMLIFWIILLVIKKREIWKDVLSFTMLWLFYCGIFFGDWGENLNIGGPSGKWYLYGDYSLIFGAIIILLIAIIYNWRKKR